MSSATNNYRKKLIEVALPLEAINEASAREKSIRHGHPSTLHLWWARRPLAAARAVIFSSLVDDPDSSDALPAFVEACRNLPYIGRNVHANGDTPRMRLFDFIEVLVRWESTTDEEVLNTARELIQIATEGNPPPLLDPFAGGGSIPLEAQRLGLEAQASDLNPVAVMINKAQIEIPPRFANMPPVNPRDRERMNSGEGWKGTAGLAADVRYYGEWMREKAWERIGHLYPTHNGETVIAWLWARTVKSPNPAVNAHVPLVRSFILSKKKGRECWALPIVEGNTVRFEVTPGLPPKGKDGTVVRTGATDIISGEPIPFDYIRAEGKAGRMGAMMMAIITEGKAGRNYYTPTDEQWHVADVPIPVDAPRTSLPEKALSFRVQVYGMDEHYKLFTPRQLVALTTFSDQIADARDQACLDAIAAGLPDDDIHLRDGGRGAHAYAEAVSVYMAFAVDRLAERGCSLASWQNSADFVRGVFSRQAIPMVWDYAEVNSFSSSSGNFYDNIEWVAKATESINFPDNHISYSSTAIQKDATNLLSNDQIVISTDPPYYDNIGYADLSDFFYVWMRKSLQNVYPDIFGTMLVPKEPELIASPYRHGGKEAANTHFESGLHRTFDNVRRFSSSNYPLTVYYAFKQQDTESMEDDEDDEKGKSIAPQQVTSTGWETMLTSLVDSGFSIDGTWPMRTERGARSIGIGTNALASSIILVCRPRAENAPTISRRGFVDTLRRELPAALKEMQSGNIAPVDLAQASIGPGMAIYSRYSKVLEADGSPMSVRTALGLINQELDTYLAEQDGDIDRDTRFAVSWFEQFGFNEGEFGQADTLARAKNTSVAGVEAAKIIDSGRGKVHLLPVHDLYEANPDWDPKDDKRATIWEATHHLIARLQRHGETGSGMLINKMPPDMAAEARQLAYRLYSICERKGWAEYARDYNALVISWSGIGEEAARLREAVQSGDATEQRPLFE
jgi:putative DNA methylase